VRLRRPEAILKVPDDGKVSGRRQAGFCHRAAGGFSCGGGWDKVHREARVNAPEDGQIRAGGDRIAARFGMQKQRQNQTQWPAFSGRRRGKGRE